MKTNKLTAEEERVIVHKGTERPFTGQFYLHADQGTYTCKQCDMPLYRSDSKFKSGCGWPSFDDEIPGAVRRIPDRDGVRTEILCAHCGGHLGHVFSGEGFTDKNIRHCVNSISLNFVPAGQPLKKDKAIFASGCFWGTEFHMQRVKGVLYTTAGYTGGHVDDPSYRQVCAGTTGHQEAVEVVFDPRLTDYETLAKMYFETHDFSQTNGQGPDIGEQYLSVIFYTSAEQKEIAQKLIQQLKDKGHSVATTLEEAGIFWPAEDYHQDYYQKKGTTPYCHVYRKIF